jgi:prolyl oligopeptidase
MPNKKSQFSNSSRPLTFLCALKAILGPSRITRFVLLLSLFGNWSCASRPVEESPSHGSLTEPGVAFSELEEVDGKSALEWVSARNKESAAILESDLLFQTIKSEVLEILDAKDRIPSISIRSQGSKVYVENFWQGPANVRGIYRRQTLSDYKLKRENWQTLIDVDKLARDENVNWVFKGLVCAPTRRERCLLMLSRGGGDAVFTREYDLIKKSFVHDGFVIPEGKVRISWRDDDSLWLGANHGEGTLSNSGYPITVRVWTRGEPIHLARELFRGQIGDVAVSASTLREWTKTGERALHVITRSTSFFQTEIYLQSVSGEWRKMSFPPETEVEGIASGRILLNFKKPSRVMGRAVAPGSVYAVDYATLQSGSQGQLEKVFEPNSRQAFSRVGITKGAVLVAYLDNVQGRLAKAEPQIRSGGKFADWVLRPLSAPGAHGTLGLAFTAHDESQYTIFYSDFLTPHSLFLMGESGSAKLLRNTPARFESNGMKVEFRWTRSRDGTKVPYFVVFPRRTEAVIRAMNEKKLPTLIQAYGGFEIPSVPTYLGVTGKVWSERGGAYVLANIRGGGEFGPLWHQSAQKEKRQNAFDDLFAVAEDLQILGFTSASHVGLRGGSNGGLLAGVALTQRPDLFGAIVSQVPLLDMLRFHKLLAGSSWVEEYGDPEKPEDRLFLERYSPFHNVKKNTHYPEALFTTSTRDDRVHPGHARRMVARLMEFGHPVLYYENVEGGHSGAATNATRAALSAREFSYLLKKLKK